MNAKAKQFLKINYSFFFSEDHRLLGTLGSILLFESLIFGKGHGGRHQNQGREGEDEASEKALFPETNVIPHTLLTLFTHSFTQSKDTQVH